MVGLDYDCRVIYDKNGNTEGCTTENLGRSGKCDEYHYFSYSVVEHSGAKATFIATRCIAGGKEPQGKNADTITLIKDYSKHKSIWTGIGEFKNLAPLYP